MRISRKGFVATAAAFSATVAASKEPAAHAAAPSATHSALRFHILKPSEYSFEDLSAALDAPHKNKQIFQASEARMIMPGVAILYLHMQNSLNAFEFSYPNSVGSLAVIGVLMAPSMIFALNDAMWKKYHFGAAFNLASTNDYYKARATKQDGAPDDPASIYQDWSAEAIMKRGGKFFVCHNATMAVAGMTAAHVGAKPEAVLADFKANMLPGFSFVPAGVAAVQLAVERGWGLFQV